MMPMKPPLVSCIMPTRSGRPVFHPSAYACFKNQTYALLELIVLADLGTSWTNGNVRFVDVARGVSVGTKRNIACDIARGEVICTWDDDDWSAPERVASQVRALFAGHGEVVGYHRCLFWDEPSECAWRWNGRTSADVIGASLMYQKSWWLTHPFPDKNVGEENLFKWSAAGEHVLDGMDAGDLMVCRSHRANTCPRNYLTGHQDHQWWVPAKASEIPDGFWGRKETPCYASH